MKVTILTVPGCTGCAKVKKILDELKINYELIDITKKPEILTRYPIMSAPGIVINGRLAFTGVPNKEALMKKLAECRR
ncbi:MAG TPA: thioredoxin family protein [Candidatus Nanoarchaeia archaeon]|nr:thioredoxin family protein [Candidatus Nanoarchaeia archaeon]